MAGEYKGFPSRRAYEDQRARNIGYTNYRQYQELRKSPLFQRFEDIKGKSDGLSRRTLRSMSTPEGREFNRAAAAMLNSGEIDFKTGKKTKSITPKTAAFYRMIGLGGRTKDYERMLRASPKLMQAARSGKERR